MVLSSELSEGISALFSLISIVLVIRLVGLIFTVALITWVVKWVWNAGSRRESRWEYRQQQRAYKQQQKRYKQRHKEWMKWKAQQDRMDAMAWDNAHRQQKQSKEVGIYSPTGWKWNENTNRWDPPENLR